MMIQYTIFTSPHSFPLTSNQWTVKSSEVTKNSLISRCEMAPWDHYVHFFIGKNQWYKLWVQSVTQNIFQQKSRRKNDSAEEFCPHSFENSYWFTDFYCLLNFPIGQSIWWSIYMGAHAFYWNCFVNVFWIIDT